MNKVMVSIKGLSRRVTNRFVMISLYPLVMFLSLTIHAAETTDAGLVNHRLDVYSVSYNLGDGQCTNTPNSLNDVDFTITPDGEYIATSFSLRSPGNNNCDDYFADIFAGDVYISTDEDVTFYINSDDGSKLWVDGNLVVDNDGAHAGQESSGTLNLNQGWHYIEVKYFNNAGSYNLTISYNSTSINGKTEIPNSALRLGGGFDTDDDGTSNFYDTDDDGDGISDINDHYPLISITGYTDTDGDGAPDDCATECLATGMQADTDDDNDGVLDGVDDFPLDPMESSDNDNDGTGDNADLDDDNDGMPDEYETLYGFDPLVDDSLEDPDGDKISNVFEYKSNTSPIDGADYHTILLEEWQSGGTTTFDFLGDDQGSSSINHIAQQGEKALVVGSRRSKTSQEIEIIRLLDNGEIDTSFANSGHLYILDSANISANELVVFDDLSFGVLITGFSGDKRFEFRKYTEDGVLDLGYADQGVITINEDTLKFEKVELLNDDNLMFSGQENYDTAILGRYLSDGTLDTSFGINGFWRTKTILGNSIVRAGAVAQQGDHFLVAVNDHIDGYLVRLDSLGNRDMSFNQNIGVVTVFYDDSADDTVKDIKVGINQGFWVVTQSNKSMIQKYFSDGTLNTSFADSGEFKFDRSRYFKQALFTENYIGILFSDSQTRVTEYHLYDLEGNPVSDYGQNGQFQFVLNYDFLSGSMALVNKHLWLVGGAGLSVNPGFEAEFASIWWLAKLLPDTDGDGINDSIDIDDNNNNLIDIYTLADINEIRNNLDGTAFFGSNAGCLSICNGFELMNDLDFDTSGNGYIDTTDDYWTTGLGWLPIGDSANRGSNAFISIFQGNNHIIKNLMSNRPDENNIALFGYTSNGAEIYNVGLTGVRIVGNASVGGLVGDLNYSKVKNVYVIGSITSGNESGGVIGYSEYSELSELYHVGNVTGAADMGGVIGYSEYDISISQLFNIGNVVGTTTVGGVIGTNYGVVTDVYSVGSVTGTSSVGGVAGYMNGAELHRVYSSASVQGETKTGAIIGWINGADNLFSSSYSIPQDGISPIGESEIIDTSISLSQAQMSCPQSAADATCSPVIYNDWDDATPVWNFGTSSELPALILNGKAFHVGDFDNDGVDDSIDKFPSLSITGFSDTDGDGAPDNCDATCLITGMSADLDDDNDGYFDTQEVGNTAPEITESSPYAITIDEDNSPTAFALMLNASDIDADTLTWSIISQGENGIASAQGDGLSQTISYEPTEHYYGIDSFDVQVSDNTGGFARITINVTINSINDIPISKPRIETGGPYGEPSEGKTLSSSTYRLDDIDGLGELTLVWRSNSVEVGQGGEYKPQMSDIGNTLTIEAQYTDGAGYSEVVISNPTGAIGINLEGDYDNDGLRNEEEVALGTDMYNEDSDNDGVNDSNDEYPLISLNGLTDTDGDGLPDTCDAACITLGMKADVYATGIIKVNPFSSCDAQNDVCGDTWENAFPYLQDALTATTANTQIWLAQGIYYPDDNQAGDLQDDPTAAFVFKQNVALIGGFTDAGFAENVSDADPEQFITVLSADITQDDTVDANNITASYKDIVGSNAYSLIRDSSHMNHFSVQGVTLTGVQGDTDNANAYENQSDSAISINHSGATLKHIEAYGNISRYGSVLSTYNNKNCTLTVENLYATNNSTHLESIIHLNGSECESNNFTNVTLTNNHGYASAFYFYSVTEDVNLNYVSVLNEDTLSDEYGDAITSEIEGGAGELSISNSTFYKVGGIGHEYSSLNVSHSTFVETQNPITAWLNDKEDAYIKFNSFINNTATRNYSAGIYFNSGSLDLFANVFVGNISGDSADNLYLNNGASMTDSGYNFLSELNSSNGGFIHDEGDNVFTHFDSGTSVVSNDAINTLISTTLADNGGDTLTLLPINGGALVDVMPAIECMFTNDQRGIIRGFNQACDLGAVEISARDILDTDGDEIANEFDTDDDNDGYPDVSDDFSLDATEWLDTDGDGTGNNADNDDDNDGIIDSQDGAPLDENIGDIIAPVISLTGNTSMTLSVGDSYVDPGFVANDNVDGDITANVVASGAVNTVTPGTYTLSYNVTDNANNSALTQTRQVTVQDISAPVITAPNNIIVAAVDASGTPQSAIEISTFLTIAHATDAVDGNVDVVYDAPDVFPLGVTTVYFDAVDLSGNAGSAQATVTVVDQTKPVVTLTGNTSMTLSVGDSYVDPGFSALDNVDGDMTANVVVGGSVDTSTVGTYTITYNVNDAASNAAITLTRQVTVQDVEAPVVITPNNIIVAAMDAFGTPISNTTISAFLNAANASDLVDGLVEVTHDAPTVFEIGTTTVTFSAVDSANNTGTAQATVTVVDQGLPVITLSGNTSITLNVGDNYTDPGFSALDNVDGDITNTVVVVGEVDTSNVGTYSITYNVSDAASNAAITLTRQVTVQDVEAPVVIAPNNIIVAAVDAFGTPISNAAISAFLSVANASDEVDGLITVTHDAPTVFEIGTTTVTFSAVDSANNTGTAQATVTVVDQGLPVITLSGNTSITLNVGDNYTDPGFSALDNVDGDITNTVVVVGEVDTSNVGTYSITYNVSDAASNAAITLTRQVTVQDVEAPVVIAPNNIIVAAVDAFGTPISNAAISAFLSVANASDEVDGLITVTHNAPTVFEIGTTTVTFSAVDSANNTGTAQATVTVVDQGLPVITLSGNTSITLSVGDNYTDPGFSALDNVDGDMTANVVVGGSVDTSTVGTYSITYNVSDAASNAAITLTRQVTVQDSSAIDSDGDGISDLNDAFPLDESESVDTDSDGTGNNADTDDDNDGVEDSNDAFPLDITESIDTDSDGTGNNADLDDDNDGISDEDDLSPLNSELGDDQVPVIGNVEVLTFEALGEFTQIALIAPEVTDNNTNAPTITSNIINALELGEHIITWTAVDFAGNQSMKTQTIFIEDTTAPEFYVLNVLTLNSKGRLTEVSAESNNVAIDLVDGELLATPMGVTVLQSGHHEIELTADDLSGNRANTTLMVDILPEVSISAQRNVEAGGTYHVPFNLSGAAPSYPVDVLYRVSLNNEVYDEESASIDIGTEGEFTITLDAELTSADVVSINVESSTNAFVGEANHTQLIVIDNNVAPLLDVELNQNGESVSVVDPDNGTVTITATVLDVNQKDTHALTWGVEESAFFDEASDNNILTFEINPENLAEAIYAVVITAAENNTAESLQVSQRIQFVVEELVALDTETDSDGDGVIDSDEGYGDSDGDGIVDYLDDDSNITRLAIGENTEPMQTSAGLTMSLGSLVASKGSSSEDASLTVDDLAALVGDDAADTQDSHFEAITPLYNFTIAGLTKQGDSVAVVIPLETDTSLPFGAVYRKYNTVNGWFAFVEDENNSVSSSFVDENGNCPPANDVSYNRESGVGLVEGDNCFQLIIEDGGPNDADFEVNGSVEDPGVIAIEQQNNSPEIILVENVEVDEESQVTLDASNSIDDDGDTLTYSWVQLSGTLVELNDLTNSQLTFIGPSVSNDEVLSFELTLDDGIDSSSQTVTITVNQVNKAPLVSIDVHSNSGHENTTLTLNATGSDSDGDALSYQWMQISEAEISFDNVINAQVTIMLPEVSADEIIEVAVTVSDGDTSTTSVTNFTISNVTEVITVTPDKSSSKSGGSMGMLLLLIILIRLRKPIYTKVAA
ncbi:immunoglobulin-like domain-containing protein [Colwellia sp. 75C3]|uniref:immunoglobulin-like domain-containing protein n=1 Tax=Colwellia sp. 75C3 TaxID=888425 RepID=UPI0018E3914A|nr:immunoglobulin-like domain-containing protein [Colwellia sp. 75C3]